MKLSKRKIIVLMLLVGIVITGWVINSTFLIKEDNTQVLMPGEKKALAIWIEQADGTYVESKNNTWPDNMDLDTDNSYCEDGAGYILENVLSYNRSSKKISFSTSEQTFCYLYFKNPA
ncbi:MAG: hypothetical protein E7167_05940 [Firmicutes bacterium]|nr:hypothetical protein [Bacillota bacterium]